MTVSECASASAETLSVLCSNLESSTPADWEIAPLHLQPAMPPITCHLYLSWRLGGESGDLGSATARATNLSQT